MSTKDALCEVCFSVNDADLMWKADVLSVARAFRAACAEKENLWLALLAIPVESDRNSAIAAFNAKSSEVRDLLASLVDIASAGLAQ